MYVNNIPKVMFVNKAIIISELLLAPILPIIGMNNPKQPTCKAMFRKTGARTLQTRKNDHFQSGPKIKINVGPVRCTIMLSVLRF